MEIRAFDAARDSAGVRSCIVELQDYERVLDPRMPAGAGVAEPLFAEMMARCRAYNGRVFVAEEGCEIAGYVTVLARVASEDTEEGDLEYGLITDLMVRASFRDRGAGRRLLEAAEAYAVAEGARWLRIDALAQNAAARALYAARGFAEHLVTLEKPLRHADGAG